jgi:hypothetical protein
MTNIMTNIMTKGHRKGIAYGLVLLTLLTAGWAGCAKTGSSFTSSSVTYVSVLHMAPYAPATDIYLNGTLSSPVGGIAPSSSSNKYSALQPGNYDIQFKKTGTDSLMADIPASSYDTLHFYTLILYNTNAGGGLVRAVKIADDFSTLSAASANYRFFNLSPDAPKVDLYLNGTAVQTSRASMDNVGYPGYNSFQQAGTGLSNSLQVKVAGSDSVLASLNNQDLEAGGVYTIFLSGVKNSSTNNLNITVLPATY